MTKNIVSKIDDSVKIDTILVSVSDKSGLDSFIPALLEINPEIRILSTGGTFSTISKILDEFSKGKGADILKHRKSSHKILEQVSDYTGQPETQGGLVKTQIGRASCRERV